MKRLLPLAGWILSLGSMSILLMSARWKLMGPLEAANGVLMFGMTSASLMAILQQLIKVQFEARRQNSHS